MDLPVNHFKRALQGGKLQIGLWSHLCSPIGSEIMGQCGLDWLVLDMEHSPNEVDTILSQLQALQNSSTMPVVRPPWNDMVLFKRLLDIGAQTLIVPYIQTEEEARHAVSYTRYPPHGVRGFAGSPRASGYGRIKDYAQRCSEEICLLLQIETLEGIKNLEAIANIEGVDGIFIGPGDLSADMGHLGNPRHPEVVKVVKEAFQRILACGKAPGVLVGDDALTREMIAAGGLFVAVGADQNVLRDGVTQLAARYKP